MKDKSKTTPENKKKLGHETLMHKLERIDKKLDLFNVLNKTVPAMFFSTLAIVSFLIYAKVNVVPTEGELPITGEEITSRFRIISPEDNTVVAIPLEIIALSIDGFYEDTVPVIFYAQDANGDIIEIGTAEKGNSSGEYRATWNNAIPGSYLLWAEIGEAESDNVLKSGSIGIDLRENHE